MPLLAFMANSRCSRLWGDHAADNSSEIGNDMTMAANWALPILLLALSPTSETVADESDFLETLSGSWRGSGQVRLKPEAKPVNVSCNLNSRTHGAALNMDGACRAKAVFSRHIGANLKAKGTRYTGSYIGATRGAGRLSGTRSGGTLNLQVRWPDRVASMQVASLGTGRMRLVTVETLAETGEKVITAQIDFSRK